MSDPVIVQGVDSIKFDNEELGLGVDQRTIPEKYTRFFQTVMPLIYGGGALVLSFVFSSMSEWFILFSIISFYMWRKKRERYLFKITEMFDSPKYLRYNKKVAEMDLEPKSNSKELKKHCPNLGNGVFFFGHELNTGQEIHVSDDKARTHLIIFGTTGSGKTETILSMCVNFLVQGSGFILVDGKGDNVLFAKGFALAFSFGRVDDIYLLNFMDHTSKYGEKTAEKITNTFNFFVDSDAAEADQIVGGLLPNDDGGGLWEGRAATGISSINQAIYYLRDEGYIQIDPDTYREYFKLENFAKLAYNSVIPKSLRAGLVTILDSVSYKAPTESEPNPKQGTATEEQFQYITMQYTETFNMLAEKYKHITVSQVPDISITDIVLRRRILIILLPSLAQSKQNVRNLGRIIIALTRNVASKALGSRVEGNAAIVIDSKPTSAISSFGLIFDEFGTYAVVGASTLPAQVRSLNIMCIFAGQDYAAFKSGNEEEAKTIFANCTLKLCMKLEDPDETFEKFEKSAGERYVVSQDSYDVKETMFDREYVKGKSARIEKRPVLNVLDLKAQKAGQATLIYGDKTFRLAMFYADPIMPHKARLNHFLEIHRPEKQSIDLMQVGIDALYKKFEKRLQGDWEFEESTIGKLVNSQEINNSLDYVDKYIDKSLSESISETELSIFILSVYAKKIELVDKSIDHVLKKSVGIDDEDYDDEDLLSDDGYVFSLSEQDDESDDDLMAESNIDLTPKNYIDPKREKALFTKIENIISEKSKTLNKAEVDSFSGLDAVDMSPYILQKKLETLESILVLKRKKYDTINDKKHLSDLVAKNIVIDMGLKTNVAIASQPEQKTKTSSLSSKEVKDVISTIIYNKGDSYDD